MYFRSIFFFLFVSTWDVVVKLQFDFPVDHQKLEREARICRLLKHANIGETRLFKVFPLWNHKVWLVKWFPTLKQTPFHRSHTICIKHNCCDTFSTEAASISQLVDQRKITLEAILIVVSKKYSKYLMLFSVLNVWFWTIVQAKPDIWRRHLDFWGVF